MYCMCYKSLIGFRITVRNMNPFRFLQIALEGINLKNVSYFSKLFYFYFISKILSYVHIIGIIIIIIISILDMLFFILPLAKLSYTLHGLPKYGLPIFFSEYHYYIIFFYRKCVAS